MLQIKPSCENCAKELPAESTEACICSYECTFCRECVAGILENVCPNCGGGFVPRPIRPKNEWREGVSRRRQPASQDAVVKPVDHAKHGEFATKIRNILPEER